MKGFYVRSKASSVLGGSGACDDAAGTLVSIEAASITMRPTLPVSLLVVLRMMAYGLCLHHRVRLA